MSEVPSKPRKSTRRRKSLKKLILELPSPNPYNPLEKKNLGASVAEALLEQDAVPLKGLEDKPFLGAGIYAIYYTGDFPLYKPIADRNIGGKFEWPIYVGKAVPEGARKALDESPATIALHDRLREHEDSIVATCDDNKIKIDDFWYRCLVVDDVWIPLGESLLIAAFSPIWNQVLDGFGNHDPGNGRYNGKRPRWDVVHPGREWAEKCRRRDETDLVIMSEIESYLRTARVPPSRLRLLGTTETPILDAEIVPDQNEVIPEDNAHGTN